MLKNLSALLLAALIVGCGTPAGAAGGSVPSQDNQTSDEVPATPSGDLTCTTVQECIEQLEEGKAPTEHTHPIADIFGLGDIGTINLNQDEDTCLGGDGQWRDCGTQSGAPSVWITQNTLGTAQNDVSGTTLSVTTTADVENEHVVVVTYAVDNTSTPGSTAALTTDCTVTGPTGLTFARAVEATAGSAAADWATVGIFYAKATQLVAGGQSVTLTCSSARVAKSMAAFEFSVNGSGLTLTVAGTDIQSDSSPAGGATPVSITAASGSNPYLWLYAIGVERFNGGSEQKDADYTTMAANIGSASPGVTTDHMELNSSYRIRTSDTDTVSPSVAITNRDMVQVFAILKAVVQVAGIEGTPPAEPPGDLVLNVPDADFNSPNLGALVTTACPGTISSGTHTFTGRSYDANGAVCFNITGTASATFNTVRIFDCASCIQQSSTGDLRVTNSEIFDFNNQGIRLWAGSNPTPHPIGVVEIDHTWIHDSATGCTSYTTQGGCSGGRGNAITVGSRAGNSFADPIYIHDNNMWNNEFANVRMVNSQHLLVDFNAFENTTFDKAGWCESPSSTNVYEDCRITNNSFVGITNTTNSAQTFTNCNDPADGAQDAIFQGNLVRGIGGGGGGVSVFALCDVDVIGNIFDGDVPGTPAIETAFVCVGLWADRYADQLPGQNKAVGNEFHNCTYPIFISEDVDGTFRNPVTITGNVFFEPYTHGIVGGHTCNSNSSCATAVGDSVQHESQYTISGNTDGDTGQSVGPFDLAA